MKTNVVSGKSVPGAFPPLLEPPSTGSEKLDNPATPAAPAFFCSAATGAVATAAAAAGAAAGRVESSRSGTRAAGAATTPGGAVMLPVG